MVVWTTATPPCDAPVEHAHVRAADGLLDGGGRLAPGPREIEGLVRVLVARLLFGDDIGRRRGGVAVRGAPWIVHDLTDVGANRVRLRGR